MKQDTQKLSKHLLGYLTGAAIGLLVSAFISWGIYSYRLPFFRFFSMNFHLATSLNLAKPEEAAIWLKNNFTGEADSALLEILFSKEVSFEQLAKIADLKMLEIKPELIIPFVFESPEKASKASIFLPSSSELEKQGFHWPIRVTTPSLCSQDAIEYGEGLLRAFQKWSNSNRNEKFMPQWLASMAGKLCVNKPDQTFRNLSAQKLPEIFAGLEENGVDCVPVRLLFLPLAAQILQAMIPSGDIKGRINEGDYELANTIISLICPQTENWEIVKDHFRLEEKIRKNLTAEKIERIQKLETTINELADEINSIIQTKIDLRGFLVAEIEHGVYEIRTNLGNGIESVVLYMNTRTFTTEGLIEEHVLDNGTKEFTLSSGRRVRIRTFREDVDYYENIRTVQNLKQEHARLSEDLKIESVEILELTKYKIIDIIESKRKNVEALLTEIWRARHNEIFCGNNEEQLVKSFSTSRGNSSGAIGEANNQLTGHALKTVDGQTKVQSITGVFNKAIVRGSKVYIRKSPDMNSDVLRLATLNDTLEVKKVLNSGWAEVEVPEAGQGYIFASYLSIPLKEFQQLEVISETTVFSGPGRNYQKLRNMKGTEKLLGMETHSGSEWSQVLLPTGETGYVLSQRVKPAQLFIALDDKFYEIMGVGWFHDKESNVRSGPGVEYSLLSTVPVGSPFVFINKQGRWYEILVNGIHGWTSVINVEIAKSNQFPPKIMELSAEAKGQLHPSLKDFVKPVLEWETSKLRIRVDDLGNNNFRYTAWPVSSSTGEKPNIIIAGGRVEFEGSGGNHTYVFSNGDFQYRCIVNVIGSDETPPGELEVYKDKKRILHSPVVRVVH